MGQRLTWIGAFALYLILIAHQAFGQRIQVGKKTIPDKGQIQFTIKGSSDLTDEDIDRIFYGYHQGKLSTLKIYYKKTDAVANKLNFLKTDMQDYSKGFEMDFEGDVFLLAKLHPELPSPLVPNLRNQDIYREIDSSMRYDIAEVTKFRDSTVYMYTRGYEMSEDPGFGKPIRLDGDVKELENRISEEFSTVNTDNVIDSILVYQAEVSNKAEFRLLDLLYGDRSDFSEAVEKILTEETRWTPAIYSSTGGKIRLARTKIYVQLMPDKTVRINFPKRLYNFTGD